MDISDSTFRGSWKTDTGLYNVSTREIRLKTSALGGSEVLVYDIAQSVEVNPQPCPKADKRNRYDLLATTYLLVGFKVNTVLPRQLCLCYLPVPK